MGRTHALIKPKIIFSIIGLSALFFLTYFTGHAQDFLSSQTLEVGPASQEISADPGELKVVKVRVRNLTKNNLPIKVRAEDFTAQGEEGQVAITANSPYSISSWTKITPDSFNLGVNENKEVTATIQIPKSGAAGGRYGSFVFTVTPPTTGTSPQAKVAQEIASLFLVKISGPVHEQINLTEFTVPQFLEFGPVPISMKFKNSGNIHEKIAGLIHVENIFHKKTADIVVKPTNIFPGSQRVLNATLDKKFLIGPYTATALLVYGTKNESINAQANFIVFPIRIVAVALLIIVFLFLARKRIRRAFRALMKG